MAKKLSKKKAKKRALGGGSRPIRQISDGAAAYRRGTNGGGSAVLTSMTSLARMLSLATSLLVIAGRLKSEVRVLHQAVSGRRLVKSPTALLHTSGSGAVRGPHIYGRGVTPGLGQSSDLD